MNRMQKALQRLLALVNRYGIKVNETHTCLGYKVTTDRDIIIDISRYE